MLPVVIIVQIQSAQKPIAAFPLPYRLYIIDHDWQAGLDFFSIGPVEKIICTRC